MENEWSLIGLFELGGVFMWPLLAFSVATLALVVERIVYLFWHNMRVADLKNEVIGLIEEGKIDEAINGLRAQPRKNTSASILLAVAQSADRGETRMEKAAEAEAQERIRRCENGFNYLTALASLSPLTGFLGTVSGMIGAFKSIASATEVNAQLVANGIYEALITTVFGLIIAIVALSAYNILVQRVDTFAAEVTKAVSDMVSAILRTQERGGAKA